MDPLAQRRLRKANPFGFAFLNILKNPLICGFFLESLFTASTTSICLLFTVFNSNFLRFRQFLKRYGHL